MADVSHSYSWSEISICYIQQILLNKNAMSINETLVWHTLVSHSSNKLTMHHSFLMPTYFSAST